MKTRTTTTLLATCVTLVLLAIGTAVQATTIYDVINNKFHFDSIKSDFWCGSGFKTGASSWTLNSVTLSMDAASNTSGNFFVKLYNTASGKPGTSLLTLSGSASPSTAGLYTYTGSYALSASTTYWIVAGVSSGSGSYKWWHAGSAVTPSPGTYAGRTSSEGLGKPYEDVITSEPTLMKIDATAGSAVPEASTLVGFGCSLAMAGPGLVGWLRRRKA